MHDESAEFKGTQGGWVYAKIGEPQPYSQHTQCPIAEATPHDAACWCRCPQRSGLGALRSHPSAPAPTCLPLLRHCAAEVSHTGRRGGLLHRAEWRHGHDDSPKSNSSLQLCALCPLVYKPRRPGSVRCCCFWAVPIPGAAAATCRCSALWMGAAAIVVARTGGASCWASMVVCYT